MNPSSLQQHHQEIMANQSLDSMLVCTKAQSQGQQQQQQQEKKPRPAEQALKCPRCDSTNTKFCYYNNYSLSQPRYFCKSCRRYWTKGGTLRNVPVGGGCRKNKRSSSSSRRSTPDHHDPHHLITSANTTPTSSSISSSSISSQNLNPLLLSPYDHHDLSLAFARLQKQVGGGGSMGFDHHENHGNISLLGGNPNGGSGNSHFDLFGNSFIEPPQTNGFQHLYYGGNGVNVPNHGEDHHHDHHNHPMGIHYDHHNQEILSNASSGASTPTTIKQELGENRVLFGLPWQLSSGNYEGSYMNGGVSHELDSLRESWSTAVLASNFHSLLNSPLM